MVVGPAQLLPERVFVRRSTAARSGTRTGGLGGGAPGTILPVMGERLSSRPSREVPREVLTKRSTCDTCRP